VFAGLALVIATVVVSLFAFFILRIVDAARLAEGVSTVAVRDVIEARFPRLRGDLGIDRCKSARTCRLC
jgi:uncharacterized membrane protein YqjE